MDPADRGRRVLEPDAERPPVTRGLARCVAAVTLQESRARPRTRCRGATFSERCGGEPEAPRGCQTMGVRLFLRVGVQQGARRRPGDASQALVRLQDARRNDPRALGYIRASRPARARQSLEAERPAAPYTKHTAVRLEWRPWATNRVAGADLCGGPGRTRRSARCYNPTFISGPAPDIARHPGDASHTRTRRDQV
jgi:hypothetical protein